MKNQISSNLAVLVLVVIASLVLLGCQNPTRITHSTEESAIAPTQKLKGEALYWPQSAEAFCRPHQWTWNVKTSALGSTPIAETTGTAQLKWAALDKRQTNIRPINWVFTPPLPLGAVVTLAPSDSNQWHTFRFNYFDAKSPVVPIIKRPVVSPYYKNLLDLARTLTQGHFAQVVKKWPSRPIPVRWSEEQSGEVDLSYCLQRAMEIWNQGTKSPWFIHDEDASWGVRLLHYGGAMLSPPLRTQLTKHDILGNPIRMNIAVGDNYTTFRDTTYVIRGMVHELAHCLLLWGHSVDRDHCLWGAAPPLVKRPSADERQAAYLLCGLPGELDLKDYLINANE